MIRATVVRTILLAAVFAGALMPVWCLGEEVNQLPTKATMELPRELLSLLQEKKMPKHSPILVRIFKEESELEVWKQDTTGHFQILKVYPICRWSGDLGPKLHEGDRQAPEGFYTITPELMNPNSNYYLAINTGFPNSFDKANERDGTFLMIHGDCWSSGCYAMTDEQMSEIYSLARDSLLGAQPSFQIQAYPFRLTPANLARHRTNPNMAFWKMLKIGNDHFEATHLEPKVSVCDRHYVFDAYSPPNSSGPPVFDPTGKCPALVVTPKVARLSLEKQRADEAEYVQLLRDDVPNMAFWKMLKIGNDHFEATHLEPKVSVCDRHYVFDAYSPPNSSGPPVFDPTGKCPALVVTPKVARLSLEKQRADEAEYVQLLRNDVPVAPIYSGLDGGMNKVFLARFPGRIIPLAIVLPPTGALDLPQMPSVPWADNDGSLANKVFGALFQRNLVSQTQVASTGSATPKPGADSATATTNKPAPAQ